MSRAAIVDNLIDVALKFSIFKRLKLAKAVTPTIQPYVYAYKRFGFKPVRRILRIAWDPIKVPEEQWDRRITVAEIAKEDIEEASYVFVEGARPYWDWWIDEEGGTQTLQSKAENG